tara:strand:+ start:603 stop:1253 length:651 start_codon:yes stop_codon:yes gene_type:complete
MPEKDNMKLWNAVCTTPPEHTKRVNQRGGFTAIGAQWQIQQATELWGPYGANWGMGALEWGTITDAAGNVVEVTLNAMFQYPNGSFPIGTDAAFRPGNDTRKKLLTDATTKALSKLGFSADVFLGKYDDNKYVQGLKEQATPAAKPPAKPQKPKKPAANPVRDKIAALVTEYGKDKCTAAKLFLIHPSGEHFAKTDPITKMGDVNQVERILKGKTE